jgi:predicted  nucleic acid-binding Zn-ribbon protein
MTTTLTRDRAYLRMCDNDDLIRLADDSRDELALVLAERLAETADVEYERDTLRDALDEATRLIDRLRDQIDDLEEEVEYLRNAIAEERRA